MAINDSQQRLLRTMITGLPGLLALKNKDLAYEVVNPAFCQFLGKAPDEIAGRKDGDLFSAEEASAAQQQERLVLKSGLPRSGEEALTGAAGKCWLEVTRIPVLNEDGDAVGLIFFARDITAMKTREAELQAGLERHGALESSAREAAERLHACEEQLKAAQAAHLGALQAAQREMEAVQAQASEAGTRLGDVQARLQQREAELAALLQRLTALQQSEAEGQQQKQRAEAALAEQERAVSSLQAEQAMLQGRLVAQEERSAGFEKSLAEAAARLVQTQADLDLHRRRHAEAVSLARRLADTLQ